MQPEFCVSPVTTGGSRRHVADRSGFLQRETSEEPQFYQLGDKRIFLGKLCEGFVDREHVLRCLRIGQTIDIRVAVLSDPEQGELKLLSDTRLCAVIR